MLSQIHSLRNTPDQATLRISHHVTGNKSRSTFYVHGVPICLKTFLYIHCMSRTRYENLVRHYHQNRWCPRVHGNVKRLPPNTLHQKEVMHLATFIKNYHISVSKPGTDLCFTCQQNNLFIQLSSCLMEVEKQMRLITAQEHLALAKKEREYYIIIIMIK